MKKIQNRKTAITRVLLGKKSIDTGFGASLFSILVIFVIEILKMKICKLKLPHDIVKNVIRLELWLF